MKDKFPMKFYYTDLYLKAQLYIESIFFAVATIISVFLFKWNCLMYIPAFIVSEFLFLALRELVSVIWYIFYWNTLSLDDKRTKLSEIIYEIRHFYPETDLMCDITSDINDILDGYDRQLASLIVEKQKMGENFSPELQLFTEMTSEFKEKINKNKHLSTDDNFALLNNLYNDLDKIINLVKEKPALSSFANKIFNIYMPETLVLASQIPGGEETKDYVDNLVKVIEEISKLAETTADTMIEFNKKSSDISFDVLIKEIQKSEEDLNGQRK